MNIQRGPMYPAGVSGTASRAPIMSRRLLRIGTYGALAVGDCLAIVTAFLIGNLVRFGTLFDPAGLISCVLMVPIYLGIVAQRQPYGARFFHDWRRTARDAATALATAILVAGLVAVYLHAAIPLSRSVVVIGGGIGMALLGANRWLLHRIAMRVLGGNPIAELLVIDDVPVVPPPGMPVLMAAAQGLEPRMDDPVALDRLGSAFAASERVVVACSPERREAWATVLKSANVQGEVVLGEMAALGMLRAARFADQPTAVVSLRPLGTVNRLVKRGFDTLVATLALAILWPVLLVTALLIRLDSPGPVLFRQPRMGRGNTLFSMLKFRSMRSDLCDARGDRSTARDDDRVTRVGRFIRATSIDELPQIFNVLRGEMSIVGPRPHALGSLAGDKLFWNVDRQYWLRHAIKPGITGLAQIHGFRGATLIEEDLANRLRSDIAYMQGWTIWRDLHILVATLRVLTHRNAF
ncbi:lipopolysaccharide/colanic/teichoic acid biosynthesis glycosyltransferase [Sphingomonas insulae]|uniref:Bacterial sugar transferase domain-containing protein n=1 Tax=Sphingomonas insulae TaxID=424800 RepID=A0ABN1HTM3_9SPHN|nr:sugar transferase [Sphingomonas insulae]NIJ28152.1 lipopolysaccharide/colanic/teichoic acid biosynthesis glycosyltransferase [Sphingomonas insulae]